MLGEIDGHDVLTPSEIKAVVARREAAQRHIAMRRRPIRRVRRAGISVEG
jgi:hypothetical protein